MIPVVFSSDHNFIMPTGVAINSLLRHSSRKDYEVFLLAAENVTDNDKSILFSIVSFYGCKLSVIDMRKNFEGAYEIRGITNSTYYRLLIPWIIPQYDKILYLDGDIAVKEDISNVYLIELGSNYLLASHPDEYDKTVFVNHAQTLGLDYNDYINAGILLINSHQIRNNNLKERFLKEAKKKYIYQDQDILNIVCKGKIARLSPEYNYIARLSEILTQKPRIIHYAGAKPWNVFTYKWYEWYEEYKLTPFYNPSLELSIFNNTYNKYFTIRELFSIFVQKLSSALCRLIKAIVR